ncbi:MAG: EscU/YscU/HrcU family type III secretion system export apparatus switch protein [Gammaproteobacteria bacterium]|nr:EscU/YscU/HrcU family type III secretion system export apparatus switch protein [Gammaproteobacteria bacterium]
MASSDQINSSPRFAIALEYDGKQAPVVTARGHHEIANEIMQIAEQENIPVHKDAELSLLLEQLDLGDHIPEALYLVIAEVLSFAYRLSGKHKDFMDDL